MLYTKIVDYKKEKILTSNAEKFIKDSKFGASIYFLGTVRNINDNKTLAIGSKNFFIISFLTIVYKLIRIMPFNYNTRNP